MMIVYWAPLRPPNWKRGVLPGEKNAKGPRLLDVGAVRKYCKYENPSHMYVVWYVYLVQIAPKSQAWSNYMT